jgi:hypothetical protein
MLNVVMLSVVMLCVIMLNVVMLSVVSCRVKIFIVKASGVCLKMVRYVKERHLLKNNTFWQTQ